MTTPKTYIQIDDIGHDQYVPYGATAINYSRVRLIINGVQIDGADCPTTQLLETLQLVQMRNYNKIVGKKL